MKVTIPEPVAWLWKWKDLPDAGWQCSMVGGWRDTSAIMTQSLITTDQAEAYAQAVRREALEEAVSAIEAIQWPVGNSPAGELAATWTEEKLIEAREAIRALIQQENKS